MIGKNTGAIANPVLAENPDLYYQTITYEGLDISQIEIGNDCTAGFMRNRYDYDANHRVIRLSNTFFMPEPVPGAYSTEYQYDLAGNILNLNRNGLLEIDNGVPVFGPTSSVYTHDANGNLTTDDGKGLAIHYWVMPQQIPPVFTKKLANPPPVGILLSSKSLTLRNDP